MRKVRRALLVAVLAASFTGVASSPQASAECDPNREGCRTACRDMQQRLESRGIAASKFFLCTQ